MIFKTCVFSIFSFFLICAESQAVSIKIKSDWNYSETLSARAPRLEFRSGPTYSLPAFNNQLGTLKSVSTKLDGNWTVSGSTSSNVDENQAVGAGWQIVVNRGTNTDFPGDSFINVEGVGAGSGRGSSSFSDSGTFTSVGRAGSFADGTDQPQLSFASRVDVGSTQNFLPAAQVHADYNAAGTFTTSYSFDLADGVNIAETVKPVLVSTTDESQQPIFVEANPQNDAVGQVQDLVGSAEIVRRDGTKEQASNGSRVNLGDQIETNSGAALNINFIDGSSFPVSDDTRLDIDEYVYDPSVTELTNFSLLKGVFVYTSGLIGRDIEDESGAPITRVYGSGIRGDANDIIKNDLLNNPTPSLGSDVGIALETASPVGVNTFVESATSDFEIEWSMAFLDPLGTFTLSYGDVELFSVDGSNDNVGISQTFSVAGDFATPGALSELLFSYDGPGGNTLLLWDILFNGNALDNLNLFGRTGKGPVSHFLLANNEQLGNLNDANLLTNGVAAVPLPAALPLMGAVFAALGFVGWRRKRRTEAV